MNAKDAWLATLGQLQIQLHRSTYDTWLRHAELLGYEDGRFVVTVPHAYARDWIERHLLTSMVQTISRSEEHTSELQSPDHLVCRLLLEKKKQTRRPGTTAHTTLP